MAARGRRERSEPNAGCRGRERRARDSARREEQESEASLGGGKNQPDRGGRETH